MAVSLGAGVIERHITCDRTNYGSDQSASLERRGLELLVREADAVKQMIDSNKHEIDKLEIPIAKKLRYYE